MLVSACFNSLPTYAAVTPAALAISTADIALPRFDESESVCPIEILDSEYAPGSPAGGQSVPRPDLNSTIGLTLSISRTSEQATARAAAVVRALLAGSTLGMLTAPAPSVGPARAVPIALLASQTGQAWPAAGG
jgi:hypothetical protein